MRSLPIALAVVIAFPLVAGGQTDLTGRTAEGGATTTEPAEIGPAVFVAINGERAYRVDDWIDAPVRLVDTGEQIGELESLMLGEGGQTIAAILDVGGFLGIGGKEVAVDVSSLRAVRAEGELYLELDATRRQIEQAEPVTLDD